MQGSWFGKGGPELGGEAFARLVSEATLGGGSPIPGTQSDPGAWLLAFAWAGKGGEQLATQALSWLGTTCQDDRDLEWEG